MAKKSQIKIIEGIIWLISAVCVFLPYAANGNEFIDTSGFFLTGTLWKVYQYISVDEILQATLLLTVIVWIPVIVAIIRGIQVLVKREQTGAGGSVACAVTAAGFTIAFPFSLVWIIRIITEEPGIQVISGNLFQSMGIGFWLGFILRLVPIVLAIIAEKAGNKTKRQNIPAPSVPIPRIPAGSVEVLNGNMKGAQIPLFQGESLVVGRDSRLCNLVVEGPKVSRKHCVIEWDDQKQIYLVTDFSSNGTKIQGGEKLPAHAVFRAEPGTVLELGSPSDQLCLKGIYK